MGSLFFSCPYQSPDVELVKEEEAEAVEVEEEMQADVSPAQDSNKDVQLISDDGETQMKRVFGYKNEIVHK